MKAKDKRRVASLINAIEKVKSICIDLEDDGVMEAHSLDIPSLDEIVIVLEDAINN